MSRSKKLWLYEDVKKSLETLGYSILTSKEDFRGVCSKIDIMCNKGHFQNVSFEVFNKRKINGQRTLNKCFECFNEAKMQLARDRANEINYTLHTSRYTGVDEEISLTCSKGHTWTTTYDRFVRVGNLCLSCNNHLLSENQKLPFYEVKKRIEVDGYTLLSEKSDYENNESLLKVRCPKGHKYKVSLGNFYQGKRCARCIQSKGENEVEKVLKFFNIQFIRQCRFEDCKNKRPLPFDFYLPSYNTCIEYDGEQHFEEGRFGLGKDDFKEIKQKDSIKTIYCEDNNIKLIRIPYWDFNNIEEILKITFNL